MAALNKENKLLLEEIMDSRLHIALINTSLTHKKRARQEFQKADLSEGQPKVLEYLYNHEGCLQKELATECYVEPATMTVLLQNMVNKGLIEKKVAYVSGGKRAFGIYLTELGRQKAIKSYEIVNDLEKISYKGFTEDEKSTLLKLLQRISDNLNKFDYEE
jgi:DNA-binding MarR family transcriptional regulator